MYMYQYVHKLQHCISHIQRIYYLQIYFGTQHSRAYLVANWLGENCATGMSWLIKKQVLEREGGMISFANYLAEDFFIGKAIWSKYV